MCFGTWFSGGVDSAGLRVGPNDLKGPLKKSFRFFFKIAEEKIMEGKKNFLSYFPNFDRIQ